MSTPWHIRWLKLEDGPWKVTKGAGIKVALLDSGVGNIRALDDKRIRRLSHDGKAITAIDRSPESHGTAVAGIVASDDRRVLGIAPEAEYSSFLVYGVDGRPADFRAAAALTAAAEQGADLICCTFTLPRLNDELRAGIQAVNEAGVPMIVSAGNRARQNDEFPEKVEGLITVAALSSEGKILPNSRYGKWTTIAAPGQRIQTWKSSGRDDPQFTGTSAAAPLLTGVIALALAQALAIAGEVGRDAVKAALPRLLSETSVRRGPVPILDPERFYAAALATATAAAAAAAAAAASATSAQAKS